MIDRPFTPDSRHGNGLKLITEKTQTMDSLAFDSPWLEDYLASLRSRSPKTVDAYRRALRQFLGWLMTLPDNTDPFQPQYLTRSALEIYLGELEQAGYSVSHRQRLKAAVAGFAQWLAEERNLPLRNPARGVRIPPDTIKTPRQLSSKQRLVLRQLVERVDEARGSALFALGFWAGCRVSDVSWLRLADTHVSSEEGWIRVGYKGGKYREIELTHHARQALETYLHLPSLRADRKFVFPSQRAERLTEAGIHQWWRTLKAQARQAEWSLIADITFHDLRHDFAHRAREAGWSLEELAYYLGHVTQQGTPAIQTTVRYTQVGKDSLTDKLALLDR
jgi:site-specific recombinase XerD